MNEEEFLAFCSLKDTQVTFLESGHDPISDESPAQEFAKKLHNYTSRATIPGVIFLGAFVSAVELPCTGAPYLAIITLLSQYFDFTAFLLLVLYNIIFVSPLIVILLNRFDADSNGLAAHVNSKRYN